MSPDWSRAGALSGGLVAFAALVGVVLWPQLPAEIAIHFSASGTPDNYVSKAVGVFLLPVIMLGTLAFMTIALRADPPSHPHTAPVALVSTMAFLAVLHALVLAWNAGYPVPLDSLLPGTLAFAVALCGYTIWREGVSLS